MLFLKRFCAGAALLLLVQPKCLAQLGVNELQQKLQLYNSNLNLLRKEHLQHRKMPQIDFYLFGMGDRKKLVYKKGSLLDGISGDTLYHWNVKKEIIVPSEYQVYLKTIDRKEVYLYENENCVFLKTTAGIKILSQSNIHLSNFSDNKYGSVLKVLHHEILINSSC